MEKNTKLMYILAIFLCFISPLYYYISGAKTDEEKAEAKVSLNFEISYAIIVFVVSAVLNVLVMFVSTVFYPVAILFSLAAWVWHAYVDFTAMKASDAGEKAKFPINFNLVK